MSKRIEQQIEALEEFQRSSKIDSGFFFSQNFHALKSYHSECYEKTIYSTDSYRCVIRVVMPTFHGDCITVSAYVSSIPPDEFCYRDNLMSDLMPAHSTPSKPLEKIESITQDIKRILKDRAKIYSSLLYKGMA